MFIFNNIFGPYTILGEAKFPPDLAYVLAKTILLGKLQVTFIFKNMLSETLPKAPYANYSATEDRKIHSDISGEASPAICCLQQRFVKDIRNVYIKIKNGLWIPFLVHWSSHVGQISNRINTMLCFIQVLYVFIYYNTAVYLLWNNM